VVEADVVGWVVVAVENVEFETEVAGAMAPPKLNAAAAGAGAALLLLPPKLNAGAEDKGA